MGTKSTQPRFYDISKRSRVLSQIHHVLSLFSGMPKSCDKSNERREFRKRSQSLERGRQFAQNLLKSAQTCSKRFLFQFHIMQQNQQCFIVKVTYCLINRYDIKDVLEMKKRISKSRSQRQLLCFLLGLGDIFSHKEMYLHRSHLDSLDGLHRIC